MNRRIRYLAVVISDLHVDGISSMKRLDLDNLASIARIDASDMLGAVDRFPTPLRSGLSGIRIRSSARTSDFRNLVLMGMGGSASAGDVVLDWLRSRLEIPSFVHREPGLPRFVDSRTLFVAISYSGETSETLTAVRMAKRREAVVAGVGTGGRLAKMCAEFRAPFVDVERSVAPRAALSQLVVAVAGVLETFGFVRSASREMNETYRELVILKDRLGVRCPRERNQAKRLASELLGRFVVSYSLQRMASVARRFKNQLAENSKEVSKYDVLPEACHNEIEGWRGPSNHAPLFIRSDESGFERSIVEAFRSTIRSAGKVHPVDVRVPGRNPLSRLLAPILLLDYASVYLALLKRIDPTPTNLIANYKRKLG